jgi:hypothetical protein
MGDELRSLFDVGNRRSGFVGGVRGDRCLLWEMGDRVLGGEGAIAIITMQIR